MMTMSDEANLADQQAHSEWLATRPDAEAFGYDPHRAGASVRSLADIESWARANGIPAEPPF